MSYIFILILFFVFSLIWEGKWPNDEKIIYIIRKGVLVFFLIISFFAFLFFETNCVEFKNNTASFGDCFYFSLITFATIGYGDILPTCDLAKNVILLETISSLIFIPVFGGYLFNQILRNRKQDILLPGFLTFKVAGENKLSINIINPGKTTINNKILFEIAIIPMGVSHHNRNLETSNYFKLDYSFHLPELNNSHELLIPYDEESLLNSRINLYELYLFFKGSDHPVSHKYYMKNYACKVTFYGQDIETNQILYSSKIYEHKNINDIS